MKRFFLSMLTAVMAIAFVGCEYDDSEVLGRLDNLENRVTTLEQLCNQMNTNISSLQSLVNALQQNDYITSVAPITEGDKIIGYTITFAKGEPITIYHGQDGKDGANGKDGADGEDGYSPVIGVAQAEDGEYYWTLDGEWLTDTEGNKIPTSGADGADGADGEDGTAGNSGMPQLNIQGGYWYVSYDGGETWERLGRATGYDGADGADGDSWFKSVVDKGDYVEFTLNDGTVITLPKDKDLVVTITKDAPSLSVARGSEIKIEYTVKGNIHNLNVSPKGLGRDDKLGSGTSNDVYYGNITINIPNNVKTGTKKEVSITITDNDTGKSVTKSWDFTVNNIVTTEEALVYAVDASDAVALGNDITLTAYLNVKSGNDAVIDLNKHKLTLTKLYGIYTRSDSKLTISNGDIELTDNTAGGYAIYVQGDVSLDKVNVTSPQYGIYVKGTWIDDKIIQEQGQATVKLTITGSTITTTSDNPDSNGGHVYAVKATNYADIQISDSTLTGSIDGGGLYLNSSKADLTKVDCKRGSAGNGSAHDIYAQNSILDYDDNCTFSTPANFRFYSSSYDSDTGKYTYGPTCVNGKYYNASGVEDSTITL